MPSKPLFGMPVVVGMSLAVMAMRNVPCAHAHAAAASEAMMNTVRRNMAEPSLKGTGSTTQTLCHATAPSARGSGAAIAPQRGALAPHLHQQRALAAQCLAKRANKRHRDGQQRQHHQHAEDRAHEEKAHAVVRG